jgi:hypothetical protein
LAGVVPQLGMIVRYGFAFEPEDKDSNNKTRPAMILFAIKVVSHLLYRSLIPNRMKGKILLRFLTISRNSLTWTKTNNGFTSTRRTFSHGWVMTWFHLTPTR